MNGPDTKVDVVVIGAGMAGASVAAELATGVHVVLIEMEAQPGYHTTGRSAAVFAPNYGPGGVRALTRASRKFFDSPPEGFADAPLLSPRQILMIARADQSATLERLIATASVDSDVEQLDAADLRCCQPLLRDGYAEAGMLDAGGQDIDVAGLHQGYLRQFKARGGTLINGAAVADLSRDGDGWIVVTRKGRIAADIVVNAAGAWADQLGQLAGAESIGLVPKRRTAMMIAEPAGFTRRDAPITIDVDEQFYLKPDAGRLLISPADETPTEPQDAQPEELDVALCADRIMTAFTLDIRRIETKWAGLRSFVADKEPVIGWSCAASGFFWMAGQGGYGIQSAPAAAKLAAALVLGQPVPSHILAEGFDAALVSPCRMRQAA
ncbi:putative FAD dependent oxidoreductase (plasmid) [Octadecabacter arcticus 238]|uniref:Putative FAD dependent oxidoreductase n=1 Tax=Octadecabacter arcticus 238 TaxID=391616 RepID=M9RS07_9RHOB|nr:FAD-dependent oxidoreductase [Octadecabacter arcticus]AGI74932.1 putative FAD dependent oxidoreductase [Octadecabacter arcticus 238]